MAFHAQFFFLLFFCGKNRQVIMNMETNLRKIKRQKPFEDTCVQSRVLWWSAVCLGFSGVVELPPTVIKRLAIS